MNASNSKPSAFNSTFSDRRQAADTARKAALEKFKNRIGPGHPEFEKLQAERVRVAAERAEREDKARQEKELRLAEERARKEAEDAERKKQELTAYMAKLAAQAELESQQKAARDARYAARKAAKKKSKSGG
jgi:hypothetical protein